MTYLPLAPIIGGCLLLAICLINIIRDPAISNNNAWLLGFGAFLFAVPMFANFKFLVPGVEISAQQQIGQQLSMQGGELKLELADIKQTLAAIATKISAPAPAQRTSPAEVVFVFYVPGQQTAALKIQNFLLNLGFAANATLTDFAEIKQEDRGGSGTARLVYLTRVKPVVQSLFDKLQQQFHDLMWSEAVNDNLSAASIEIKVF